LVALEGTIRLSGALAKPILTAAETNEVASAAYPIEE
jgi:hypothetical protein